MERNEFLKGLRNTEKRPEVVREEALDNMLIIYEKLSDKDIMESMKRLDDLSRAQLELKALLSGNQELAGRINAAMKNLETEQIEGLRIAIQEGKQEEFLSQLSWVEKSNLSVVIKSRNDILVGIDEDFSKASPEDRVLLETLEQSMDRDLLEQAKAEGFDNLEDWRANNAKKYSSTKFEGFSL